MGCPECTLRLRVRYAETDQMGGYYNSRVLEWFECGRTELLRDRGIPYAEMEARGSFLPLVEAHIDYAGPARYDDELIVTTTAAAHGKARLRFDVAVVRAKDGAPVASGHTIHAITDANRKPARPPGWLITALAEA